MATKVQAKKTESKGASEKQASDTTKVMFNKADWPMGAIVAYTGTRVSEHVGMQGPVVGYRPTSGLWIKFPNGRGSISVKQAKLVAKAQAKPSATPTAKAKAAPKAKAAETKPTQAEPAKTA